MSTYVRMHQTSADGINKRAIAKGHVKPSQVLMGCADKHMVPLLDFQLIVISPCQHLPPAKSWCQGTDSVSLMFD